MEDKDKILSDFAQKAEGKSAEELILAANDYFAKGKLAIFSSFGTYSALLLSMIAKVNPDMPVLFLDTGKHFSETISYVDEIANDLGLKNLTKLTPDLKILNNVDKDGDLWESNVDRCCWIRKVEPLDRHLAEAQYTAVITGRRGYQTDKRAEMKVIELDDKNNIRINPFYNWSKAEVVAEFEKRGLKQHPLLKKGYPSIGCAPCTFPVKAGEDERSGRWAHINNNNEAGYQKTECGIHLSKDEVANWVI